MAVEAPVAQKLIVGGGAREFAVGKRLRQDAINRGREVGLHFAPGNGGTSEIGINHDIAAADIDRITALAVDRRIGQVFFGPEAPLIAGGVDAINAAAKESDLDLTAFGPSEKAARLEGSKAYAVEIMRKYGIPHPESHVFTDASSALAFVEANDPKQLVIKADGQAGGKGVTLPETYEEAGRDLLDLFVKGVHGGAGRERVVIQKRETGPEASVTVLMSNDIVYLPTARDFKRAHNGDQGPNTGGMGTYSPNELVTPEIQSEIHHGIVSPLREAMIQELGGGGYKGALYVQVMLTSEGPKVIEFNVRLGDSETSSILPRIITPFSTLVDATISGGLYPEMIAIRPEATATIVLAAKGYPENPEKGKRVQVPARLPKDVIVDFAGVRKDEDGSLVSSGGRVVEVTTFGKDPASAAENVLNFVGKFGQDGVVAVEDGFHRTDIGPTPNQP